MQDKKKTSTMPCEWNREMANAHEKKENFENNHLIFVIYT